MRRHVWFYNGERGEARTEIDQTSQTELGRKSQEQFVTVASPALPMQNWHLAGSVRTENTRERGRRANELIFIIRELGAGEQMQDRGHLTSINLLSSRELLYLMSGRALMSISHKYQTLS